MGKKKYFRKAPILRLLVVFSLFFSFCGGKKDAVVQTKVAEAIEKYREKRQLECRTKLLQEAEKIVDSILLKEAQLSLNDSLTSQKPVKPTKPAPISPIDSETVKPIFQ